MTTVKYKLEKKKTLQKAQNDVSGTCVSSEGYQDTEPNMLINDSEILREGTPSNLRDLVSNKNGEDSYFHRELELLGDHALAVSSNV